jgi:hypothetical protein
MAKINVWIIKEFSFKKIHNATWILVSSSGTITSHWNLMAWNFSTFKSLFWNYFNLKHVANNVWIFDNYNYGQRMTIYIIHGPFDDVTLSHHLRLNVGCNFTYAIKTILVVNVSCNYFIVTNWNHKLILFF